MRFKLEDYIKALKNWKWEHEWVVINQPLHDASFDEEVRSQIITYREYFAKNDVHLLDHEIVTIWHWVSLCRDMEWRSMGMIEDDVARIEEFVAHWIKANDGYKF